MISVSEAEKIIHQHLFKPEVHEVVLQDTIGNVLAEDIHCDRDFPPFNRVAMDGIAIQYESYKEGVRKFGIESIQPAGVAQGELLNKKNCIEVMTGASLPKNTDTVIRYEDLNISNSIATITVNDISHYQNVHPQGADSRAGDLILQKGDPISPAEIALLASVGKNKVIVYKKPKIIIVATGDELVDVTQIPLPHQIRSSNSFSLQAAFRRDGFSADTVKISDDTNILEKEIPALLSKYDLMILTGGVSKGKYDYIPAVLEKSGIKKLFHVVAQRPGKPLWFGNSEKNTVFALPGNPVSSFMCYHRYVKPWLSESLGLSNPKHYGILDSDFTFQPPLTYFLQVSIRNEMGILKASPVQGGGSGDFVNLKEVNGFLELPADKSVFKTGEPYPYFPFRD